MRQDIRTSQARGFGYREVQIVVPCFILGQATKISATPRCHSSLSMQQSVLPSKWFITGWGLKP